jgi:cytochrome P450
MMLGAGIPAEEWDNLFVKQGLQIGDNFPWAGPRQRLVYRHATYDVMREEFDKWIAERRILA